MPAVIQVEKTKFEETKNTFSKLVQSLKGLGFQASLEEVGVEDKGLPANDENIELASEATLNNRLLFINCVKFLRPAHAILCLRRPIFLHLNLILTLFLPSLLQ